MRIDNQGNFRACRWRANNDFDIGNIRDIDPEIFFSEKLNPLRLALLNGQSLGMCQDCHHMEEHGKISGRQRQLLKIGVKENFEKSILSSPWIEEFKISLSSQGRTDLVPMDWQIDLGNQCNGACIFCIPEYSSRLASEFYKIGLISRLPSSNWTDDIKLVEKFADYICRTPHHAYLHFLGGETLIVPAFKILLERLLEAGKTNLDIGFTTNLTVWPQDVIDILCQFNKIHVGLSIECLTELNDYLRYPSKINQVTSYLESWVRLSKDKNWLVSIRPTPNCFSIMHLAGLYEYALKNSVAIETCNFLEHPRYLRINVLSNDLLFEAKQNLSSFLNRYAHLSSDEKVVNVRHPNLVQQQVYQDAQSYVHYIENEKHESDLARDLVKYLDLLEKNRGNRILDYLPGYEDFLRSAGYRA